MKPLPFVLLFLLSFVSFAQDYYAELEARLPELFDKKDYQELYQVSKQILNVNPTNIAAVFNQAAALIFLNRPAEALNYVETALTLDPTASSMLTAKAYLMANSGNTEAARHLLKEAMRYDSEEPNVRKTTDEMHEVGRILGQPDTFKDLANWFTQNIPSFTEKSPSLVTITATYNKYPENPDQLMKEAIRLASGFYLQNRPDMAALAYSYASHWLRNWGYRSEALTILNEGYVQLKSKGFGNNYYIANNLLASLIALNIDKNELETAAQYGNEFISNLGKSAIPAIDIDGLVNISSTYGLMRNANKDMALKYGIMAYDLAVKNNYIAGMANAANAITICSVDFYSPESTSIGIRYGEYGYKIAEENKLGIKSSILSNLALLYWSTGNEGKQKCINIMRFQISKAKEENRLDQASLYLNNLGAMYYSQREVAQAVNLFEESATLAQYGPQYNNPKDRLAFYEQQMSANQWLVTCYAQMGNAEKTFEAMERSRARILNERLSKNKLETPVLYDLQNLLKPDEACIMYDVFSGHELVILVVTKKYAHVLFHDDPRFIGDIRDKYFNKNTEEQKTDQVSEEEARGFEWISVSTQRTQVVRGYDKEEVAPRADFERVAKLTRKFSEDPGLNDKLLDEFLTRYQRYLIVPINNRLGGIKTLLISPSDLLSFIPFEALKTFDGKYLVEKYNVRYLHSTSVWMQLEARKYNDSRKPLLAMGGAIYQEMEEEPMALNSVEALNLLKAEVAEKIDSGSSLRKAYASVFGTAAMNPLPGTLEEVKSISKSLPGAEVFTEKDMTENRIKSMSANDQLKNYKILHLATHGFVVSEIPDLSGVALSIFPKEQDGEDGFLNAVEISNLKLNCDLTVLSACQTALGKLYVGEGVTGLTQSLLLAGSNAALVSLWPVNDTSTMLFMSNFYKEVSKGKPYPQIVNDLKRKFIKGEFGKEFQHPNFWAPFIYYGK